MWTTDYSIDVPAPADQVWAVLRDIDGWHRWNDGIESLVLNGPVAVGSIFVMTPPGEDPITSTLVELREGSEISDLADFGGLQILVRHLVAATGTTTSTVTYRIEVSGQAPDEVAQEVGEQVSADFPAVLAGLRAVVQNRPVRSSTSGQ